MTSCHAGTLRTRVVYCLARLHWNRGRAEQFRNTIADIVHGNCHSPRNRKQSGVALGTGGHPQDIAILTVTRATASDVELPRTLCHARTKRPGYVLERQVRRNCNLNQWDRQ